MKNLLIVLGLFLCITSYAQDTIPLEGANVILISNERNSLENFLFVKSILGKKKIKIAIEDKEKFTVKTKDIKISRTGALANFNIVCREKQIQLEGGVKPGEVMYIGGKEFKGAYIKISNNGRFTPAGIKTKNNMFTDAFDAMDDLAKAFGSSLFYLINHK
ncbi:hypothetical protein EZ428_17290 [Pedobacter frigiditerrae]|uniref:Uncharacterized protein n=1 Tax=Pedobacter frigiditerrae TaxID=2530452 RepID=A0A4V2MI90_9SPHI|nr:hypothetical protein [Pedobacter frigiditerrae]TCC89446.1 hypothetical protein EZ428_17290 [Pedobacter frigiditerrae]